MTRILLLTYYFKPDLSAGSFRMNALVNSLAQLARNDLSVDLFTTIPNRYHQFNKQAPEIEQTDKTTIYRYEIPQHKNGFIDQAKAYRHFFKWAKQKSRENKYDLVFATSSRLFTAYLGSQIAKEQKCPLYLDIRDIFVDTIGDILSPPLQIALLPIFKSIEKRIFQQASHLNIVSEGFSDYFKSKVKLNCKITTLSNGIDECFLQQNFNKSVRTNRLKIVYAGNIGEGQGLHKIIPDLAKLSHEFADFDIIGSGGQLSLLEENCRSLNNIKILPPIDRIELIETYKNADILFLHLNDYDAFLRVLPSKIFEYAATGKPVLAGVSGFAKKFLHENVERSWVFEPCNIQQAYQFLLDIKNQGAPFGNRDAFCEKFNRIALSNDLANSIIGYL